MRLYKLLNRYIDLDHVLSVTDPTPNLWCVSENDYRLGFEITMMMLDKPVQVYYGTTDTKEYRDYERAYIDANKQSSFSFSEVQDLFRNEKKPVLDEIHAAFIRAWENKPELVVLPNTPYDSKWDTI